MHIKADPVRKALAKHTQGTEFQLLQWHTPVIHASRPRKPKLGLAGEKKKQQSSHLRLCSVFHKPHVHIPMCCLHTNTGTHAYQQADEDQRIRKYFKGYLFSIITNDITQEQTKIEKKTGTGVFLFMYIKS